MVALDYMTIDTQLYLITAGLALGSAVAAWQAFQLRNFYRSGSALFGAFVFLSLGARQIYTLIRLHAAIADARARGIMIDHLSTEQWIVGVAWTYQITIGFIVWQYWKRQDLRKYGI